MSRKLTFLRKKTWAPPTPVTDRLLLWYDAINNTGLGHSNTATAWKDLSGNNRDGVLMNSPAWSDDAINCNGVNQYIQTPLNNQALGLQFSIQCTFLATDVSSHRGLIGAHQTGNGLYCLQWETSSGGYIGLSGYTASSQLKYLLAPNSNYLNKTANIGMSISSGSSGKCYVNGIFAGNMALTGSAFTQLENLNIRIGVCLLGANRYWKGRIMSPRIYGKVLSDAEFLQNYAYEKSRYNLP